MSCGFLCFHLCGSGVPVTTTCHCCAVVFLQSRRMRRSLHTLRCVRPLRLMAQLSLPVCRRTAACSPQTDFPGVHTRPHPVSVVQGRDVPATKLFAASVKNFCVCPRTTAPCRGSRCPIGKVHCGEKPRRSGRQKGLSPLRGATGRPGDLIQQKETFS